MLGVLAVAGALAAFRLVTVAHDLERARKMLDSAGSHIEAGQLAIARDELRSAQNILTRSNSQLHSDPALVLLDPLPVVHQNLASLRDTVGVALRMTDGGSRILAITQPLESADGKLEVPLQQGQIPLKAVSDAQAVTQQLSAALPLPGVSPNRSLLFGPVADAQDLLYKEAGRRRSQLDAVSRGLDLLSALSGSTGPKRYLIAVANSAEMRGAGGMVLSYGVLSSSNGAFKLAGFGNIDELFLDAPVDPGKLELPADYLQRWQGLDPTHLWRNTTLNPELAFDAPVMQAMFTAKTGLPVDGVIQIDPAGLAAILAGTGPVQVEGLGQVDASNVVDLTINRAYIDFPNRDQRQEVLGDVAHAAFDALLQGQFHTLRPLGDALYQAAVERHLSLYANDVRTQRLAASFNATAELPPADRQDYALLSVQNFSRNKLDYYIDSSLELRGERKQGALGNVEATITVANAAPPDGASSYVFGPNGPEEQRGLYRSVVSLYLPTGTSVEVLDAAAAASPPVLTTEAGRSVATFGLDVGIGESKAVRLRLVLPPRAKGAYQLTLVPVPRVRPTVVAVDIDAGGAVVRREPGPLKKVETVIASK